MKTNTQTRKNRILSLLLTLVMILPMVPVAVLTVATPVAADTVVTLADYDFEDQLPGQYGSAMTYEKKLYFRVRLVRTDDASIVVDPNAGSYGSSGIDGISYNNTSNLILSMTYDQISTRSDFKTYVDGIAAGTNSLGVVSTPVHVDTWTLSVNESNGEGGSTAHEYYRQATYVYGWYNFGSNGDRSDLEMMAAGSTGNRLGVYHIREADGNKYLSVPFDGHSMTASGAPMNQSGNADRYGYISHTAITQASGYVVIEAKYRFNSTRAGEINVGFMNISGTTSSGSFSGTESRLFYLNPGSGALSANGGSTTGAAGLIRGAWNTIRVVIDFSASRYDIYVNGTLYYDDAKLNSNNGNAVYDSVTSINLQNLYVAKCLRATGLPSGKASAETTEIGAIPVYIENNVCAIDVDDVLMETHTTAPAAPVSSTPLSGFSLPNVFDVHKQGTSDAYLRVPFVGVNGNTAGAAYGNVDSSLLLQNDAISYSTTNYAILTADMRYHYSEEVGGTPRYQIQFFTLTASGSGKEYVDIVTFCPANGNFYREADYTCTTVPKGTYFDEDEWFRLEIVFNLQTGYFWIYTNGVLNESITANSASNSNAHNRLYKGGFLTNISVGANQLYIAKCMKSNAGSSGYNRFDSTLDTTYVDFRNVTFGAYGSSRTQTLADFSKDAGKKGTGSGSQNSLTGVTQTPYVWSIEDGYLRIPLTLGSLSGSDSDMPNTGWISDAPLDIGVKLVASSMAYSSYTTVTMEARYFFSPGSLCRVESQWNYCQNNGSSVEWQNLYYIKANGGTTGQLFTGNGAANLGFTLGEWHTVRMTVTLASGAAHLYLDDNEVGSGFNLGISNITLNANCWIFGKVNKLKTAGISIGDWKAANYKDGVAVTNFCIDDVRLWGNSAADANVNVYDWDGNLLDTDTVPTGYYELPLNGAATGNVRVVTPRLGGVQNYPAGTSAITLTDDANIYVSLISTTENDAYQPITNTVDGRGFTPSSWQGSPTWSIEDGGSGIGGAKEDGCLHMALVPDNHNKGFFTKHSAVSTGDYIIYQADFMYDEGVTEGIFSVRLGGVNLSASSNYVGTAAHLDGHPAYTGSRPGGVSFVYFFAIDTGAHNIMYHSPGNYTTVSGEHTLESGTWYRITAVMDTVNGVNRVYVNGELDNPTVAGQQVEGQIKVGEQWYLFSYLTNFSIGANTVTQLVQDGYSVAGNGSNGINVDNIVVDIASDCYVVNGDLIVNNTAPDFTKYTPEGKTRLFTSVTTPANVVSATTATTAATYDGYDFRVYNLGMELLYGGSVRVSNPSGLRFMSALDKDDVDALNAFKDGVGSAVLTDIQVGTMIAPTAYVGYLLELDGDYSNFTMDGLEDLFGDARGTGENEDYINVRAGFNNWLDEWDDVYIFAGSIVNINNRSRDFSGRSYFRYTVNGVETILWSNYDVASNSRNIKWVAQQALADESYSSPYSGKLSSEQRATLEALAE